MNDSGYIRIYRQIRSWEWYKSPNTLVLFLHLLLTANYTDGRFEGELVKRGQLVTSIPSLSAGTGLTVKEVRTALDHLLRTGEVADRKIRRGRVITISKYDDFQGGADESAVYGQANGRQTAGYGQAEGRQTAGKGQQYNNNKNIKREEEKEEQEEIAEPPSPRRMVHPTKEQVLDFCAGEGISIDVDKFFDYYDSVGWKIGGRAAMKDWKATVRNWARRDAKAAPAPQYRKTVPAQQYEQRDYSQYNQDDGIAMMVAMMQRGDDV